MRPSRLSVLLLAIPFTLVALQQQAQTRKNENVRESKRNQPSPSGNAADTKQTQGELTTQNPSYSINYSATDAHPPQPSQPFHFVPESFGDLAQVALLLITAAYLWFTIQIWRQMVAQNRIAQQSLERTRRPAMLLASISRIEHFEPEISNDVMLVLENGGGGFAHSMRALGYWSLRNTDASLDDLFQMPDQTGTICSVRPGGKHDLPVRIDGFVAEAVDRIQRGTMRLYIVCTATFVDETEKKYEARHVSFYDREGGWNMLEHHPSIPTPD